MIQIQNKSSCDLCPEKKAITLTYGPHNFCEKHFIYFFERRVKRTVRQYNMISKSDVVAIGVSGGKDSVAVLHLLSDIVGKRNKLFGISVDEGIKGYRDLALEEAKKNYKELGIDFVTVSYEEKFGTNMVEVVKEIHSNELPQKSCSFCGVFRRRSLNDAAIEFGASKLATGHNLDDEVQSICMNIFENDLERLARLGPVTDSKIDGLIPRIKPLYSSPEMEIPVYAMMKNYPFYMEECCPFSSQAKRNHFREMLNKMEASLPGTKYSILNSFFRMKPLLNSFKSEGKLKECIKCAAISAGEKCQACLMLEKLGLKANYIKTNLGNNNFQKAENLFVEN